MSRHTTRDSRRFGKARLAIAGVAALICAGVVTAALLPRGPQPFGQNYSACANRRHQSQVPASQTAPLFFVTGKRLAAPGMSATKIRRSVVSWDSSDTGVADLKVTTAVAVAAGRPPATVLWTPSASLAHNAIAYIQGSALEVGRFGGQGNLVVSAADGTDPHTVVTTGITDPVWSPGGRQIAFVNDGIVFVIGASGRHEREVGGPGGVGTITWSPNGACIAASAGQAPGRIVIINVRTGAYAWLTPADEAGYYPAWSPRGNELVYAGSSGSLVIANLASGRTRELAACPPSSCSQELWPAWSPDGSLIAFVRSNGGPEQIFAVPASGGTPRQITSGPNQHTSPTW